MGLNDGRVETVIESKHDGRRSGSEDLSGDPAAPGRLSHVLRSVAGTGADAGISAGELLDRGSERSFGFLLILIALPALFPLLPPGASAVVGALSASIGLHMFLGLSRVWLPRRVREHRLSPVVMNALHTRGAALMERLERYARPRWRFMESAVMLRLLGAQVMAIGLVLFLPLPFMNTLPALGLLMMGVGLSNRDGVLLLLSVLLCLLVLAILLFAGHLLDRAWDVLRAFFAV